LIRTRPGQTFCGRRRRWSPSTFRLSFSWRRFFYLYLHRRQPM